MTPSPRVLAAALTVALAGCGHVGRRAMHFLELAETLSSDLAGLHEQTGSYPESLEQLPAYRELARRQRAMFRYTRTETGYLLEMMHGPCINYCTHEPYQPATGRGGSWVCQRYC